MLHFKTGIPGAEQESSFMNATLQRADDSLLDFSIAVHVTVTEPNLSENDLIAYLREVFAPIATDDRVEVEIQIGPADIRSEP